MARNSSSSAATDMLLTTTIAVNVFECEAQSIFQFTLPFLDFDKLRGNLSLWEVKSPPKPIRLNNA